MLQFLQVCLSEHYGKNAHDRNSSMPGKGHAPHAEATGTTRCSPGAWRCFFPFAALCFALPTASLAAFPAKLRKFWISVSASGASAKNYKHHDNKCKQEEQPGGQHM